MICTEYDDYVRDYQEMYPSWVVGLHSGLVVYQDDYRVEPYSAWERLYNYCQENNDFIQSMRIQFRSNVHQLPDHADGYYFSKGVRGCWGMTKTMQLFFVGILNQGVLNVTCWKVPEMMKEVTEERDPTKAGICLIRNNAIPLI